MKIKLTPKNGNPVMLFEVNALPPSPPSSKAQLMALLNKYKRAINLASTVSIEISDK